MASLIPAFWHCRPFEQQVITEFRVNPAEIESSCPQVEIYRIQDNTTEYKTEFDVNEHDETETNAPQVEIYRIHDHTTEYKTEFDVNEHDETETNAPQVEIYRIQDHKTEYKTGN